VKRREFINFLGGAVAAWPLAARAQSAHVPVIGFLGLAPASGFTPNIEALRQGLRDLGYVEGKNIVIEFRWAENPDQLPGVAAEFVRMRVDVIFAPSSTYVEPALQATKTIPIVFAAHADPVGLGHVASLPRPGGNVTGLSMLLTELAAKDLEILTQTLPQATRIGVLSNPTTPSHRLALRTVANAGEKLGVKLVDVPAGAVEDFDRAFATLSLDGVAGLLVVGSPLFNSQRTRLVARFNQFERI
jgi:putative tryptophan/tyrosine transport system substrate-binding protein